MHTQPPVQALYTKPRLFGLQLGHVLGSGGMATVYVAQRPNGDRVAAKVLHAWLADRAHYRALLQREAEVASTLSHPGVVRVHDVSVREGHAPYLLLELLEGSPLRDPGLERERHGVHALVQLVDQLLDVLSALHARGLVHHDIKPENLFVTRDGQLKLIDFGLATRPGALRETARALRAATVGTPAYMAQEQARGCWEQIDHRTDLWAVGATMFALLTGEHVHDAPTRDERLARAMSMPARSLRALRPDIPEALCDVVDRALRYERNARWPDAPTMRYALQSALAGIELSDPRPRRRVRKVSGSVTITNAGVPLSTDTCA